MTIHGTAMNCLRVFTAGDAGMAAQMGLAVNRALLSKAQEAVRRHATREWQSNDVDGSFCFSPFVAAPECRPAYHAQGCASTNAELEAMLCVEREAA
jgi:hypothetical protein